MHRMSNVEQAWQNFVQVNGYLFWVDAAKALPSFNRVDWRIFTRTIGKKVGQDLKCFDGGRPVNLRSHRTSYDRHSFNGYFPHLGVIRISTFNSFEVFEQYAQQRLKIRLKALTTSHR